MVAADVFVSADGAEDGVEGAEAQGGMSGNRYSMVRRRLCLQNNMAPDLMDDWIAPVTTQDFDGFLPAQVTR